MKILLTGSSGQLGKSIIKFKPKNINLLTPNSTEMNLGDIEKCKKFILTEKPDWVINSGAFTHVDNAELFKFREEVFKINCKSVETFCKALNKYEGKLMQISTDYVFDGNSKKPYETYDETNPNNIYGKSKSLAEKYIKNYLKGMNQYIILRTSWLVSPYGRNFVLTIMKLLKEKDSINVVNDQIGEMTSANNLANLCWKLIEANTLKTKNQDFFPSTHHWSDEGIVTWYDIAIAIKEITSELKIINNPAKVNPIKSEKFNLKVKRPKYSVLKCSDTENLLKINRVHWRTSLSEIIKEISSF